MAEAESFFNLKRLVNAEDLVKKEHPRKFGTLKFGMRFGFKKVLDSKVRLALKAWDQHWIRSLLKS